MAVRACECFEELGAWWSEVGIWCACEADVESCRGRAGGMYELGEGEETVGHDERNTGTERDAEVTDQSRSVLGLVVGEEDAVGAGSPDSLAELAVVGGVRVPVGRA